MSEKFLAPNPPRAHLSAMSSTLRLAKLVSVALTFALTSSRLHSAAQPADDLDGARLEIAALMDPAKINLIADAHRTMARGESMIVSCTVSPEGRVTSAEIIRGTGRKATDTEWLATVRQARLAPRLVAGHPVEYTTTFEVTPKC